MPSAATSRANALVKASTAPYRIDRPEGSPAGWRLSASRQLVAGSGQDGAAELVGSLVVAYEAAYLPVDVFGVSGMKDRKRSGGIGREILVGLHAESFAQRGSGCPSSLRADVLPLSG